MNLRYTVFAYGSNLFPPRLRERVGEAERLGVGCVAGRRLTFRKRSVDGSAKADAMLTERLEDRVWGAVYQLDATQKRALDRCEFLGIGYDEHPVQVLCDQQPLDAVLYAARSEAIDESLRPYAWYLNLVIAGARLHRLPEQYIEALQRVAVQQDDDTARRQAHEALLRPDDGRQEKREGGG